MHRDCQKASLLLKHLLPALHHRRDVIAVFDAALEHGEGQRVVSSLTVK